MLENSDTIKQMHAVLVLLRPLPNVGIQNFGMWGMYTLVKAYRSIQKSIANLRVEDWEASNGRTEDTTRLFHGPWHDPVGEHLGAQPCRMWNRLRFHPFLQVSQIFQRRKSDTNKHNFENKLNLTCQAQSTSKTIGILTKVFWTSGPNLVVLAWTDDELSHGQAQNGVNFYFEGKFDLEGKSQSPPKTIGTLTKVFYIYGSNLVILASTGLELSRGQASDWHTDGQTDAGNDNTRWPYRPRVITTIYPPESHEYLDCFTDLTVSWVPSSAHTCIPRLFHGSNCFTVSTCCTYTDLGSWGYFGVYRPSCFSLTHLNYFNITGTFIIYLEIIISLKLKYHEKVCGKEWPSYLIFFPTFISAHSQTEMSAWSWRSSLQREWYSFN